MEDEMNSRRTFILITGIILFLTFLVFFRSIFGFGTAFDSFNLYILGYFVFIGICFWGRLQVKKRGTWISFIPSFPFIAISIFLFVIWIIQKGYLPCPEDGFCEDYLTPMMVFAVAIAVILTLYSLAFEFMYARKRSTIDSVVPAIEKKEIADSIDSKSSSKKFFDSAVGNMIVVVFSGLVFFGLAYVFFALIDLLLREIHSPVPDWIISLTYSLMITIVFLVNERKKILTPLKAGILIPSIVIWITGSSQIGMENYPHFQGVFLSYLLPILALCYVYINKRPVYYYIAIILSTIVGIFLVK